MTLADQVGDNMSDRYGIHTYPTVFYIDSLPVINAYKTAKAEYLPTEMIYGERITENALLSFIRE